MLARLDPRAPALWFPLGEQDKEQTREEARRAGLAAAERARARRHASWPAATTATS